MCMITPLPKCATAVMHSRQLARIAKLTSIYTSLVGVFSRGLESQII